MSTLGEQLTALRETVAGRRGWGPRTIGRLSTRRSLSGAVEWVAVVFVSDEDDQRKARRALSGVGATDDEALLNLRTRIQEGSDEE